MTRKRLAWVCLLLSPLLLGGAALFLLPRDPITQANCDKIKKGMTLRELVALLGKENLLFINHTQSGPTEFLWNGSKGIITISFQTLRKPQMQEMLEQIGTPPVEVDNFYISCWGNTLVESAEFSPRGPETIVERIRNWLNL